MTVAELKKLLSAVIDFSEKSAVEVYRETLPPKIRDAIKKHEMLVGMNRDMVIMAKDRPEQKVREKDDKGKEYEDWIYGKVPQDVEFVRLVGDEVTMVKISKVVGQVVVKTEKEVDIKDGVASLAALNAGACREEAPHPEETQQPARKPTLRREGEQPEPTLQLPTTGQSQPRPPPEPAWGTGTKPQDQQKPPQ